MIEVLKKISIPKIVVLTVTTFIILFFLFRYVNQINLQSVLENSNVYYFCLSIIIGLITFILSAARWFYLVKIAGYSIKFKKIFSLVSSSFALSMIPGRLGDFARTYPLKNDLPITTGIGTIILEKIIDIMVLLTLAAIGLIFWQIQWSLLVIVLILFIPLIIKISSLFYHKLKNPLPVINEFYQIIGKIKYHKKYFYLTILSSLINWFVSIVMTLILFKTFGYSVDLTIVMAYLPLAIFAGLIPVSLAGFGTRESVLVFLLSLQNIPTNVSLLVGLSYSFISYFIFSLVGIPFFIKEFKKSYRSIL